MRWEDLNARARGLGAHLLTRRELEALAQATDSGALADALRHRGYPVAEGERTAVALELAVRRVGALRLRILARWAGPRTAALAVVFEDEDRRSLRALLRGAVQGAPVDERLAGLIPTPALPERALRQLGEQRSPAGIAALLTAWRSPYGSIVLPLTAARQPDLYALELALSRTFAARALRAARGGGLLVAYVQETIDLENASAALVLAAEGKDGVSAEAFLPGGARVSHEVFRMALAAGRPLEAGHLLAAAFSGTDFAPVFERHAGDPAELEDVVLRVRIRALTRALRAAPLGPAPLLAYALRARAEAIDLRRIVWGVALAAPRVALTHSLVTA